MALRSHAAACQAPDGSLDLLPELRYLPCMKKNRDPERVPLNARLEVYAEDLRRVRQEKEKFLRLERLLEELIAETKSAASGVDNSPALAAEPKSAVPTRRFNQMVLGPAPLKVSPIGKVPAGASKSPQRSLSASPRKRSVADISFDLVVAMLPDEHSRFVRREFEDRLRAEGVEVKKRTAENNLGPLVKGAFIRWESRDESGQCIYQQGPNWSA